MDTTSIIIMIVAVLVVGGIIYYFTKKVTLEQATLAAQQAIQKAVTDERIAAEAAQKAAVTQSLDDAKVAAEAAQVAAVSKAVADQKVADLAECNARVSKELADQKVKLDATCKASLDKAIADAKLASDAALKAAITKTTADNQAAADAAQKAAVSKAIAETQAAASAAQQAAVAKAIADAKIASDAVLKAKISEIEAKAKVDLLNYDPRMINCSPTDIVNYDCFISRTYNRLIKNPDFTKLPDNIENEIKQVFIKPKSELIKGMSSEFGKKTVKDLDDQIDRLFAENIPKTATTQLDAIMKVKCNDNDVTSYECYVQEFLNAFDDAIEYGKTINVRIDENKIKEAITRITTTPKEDFIKDDPARDFIGKMKVSDTRAFWQKTLKDEIDREKSKQQTATGGGVSSYIRYNNMYRIMTSKLRLDI